MPSTTLHTARTTRPCAFARHHEDDHTINAGDLYVRSVAFPGDDGHEEGTRPWVMRVCVPCADVQVEWMRHQYDEILIRATVTRWEPGVGALVELFSKTDQYDAWIRPDLIADVILPDPPTEPADGTWLAGVNGTRPRVFIRNDSDGLRDPDRCAPPRRYARRWWDVTAEQWIDWPTAVRRGADPSTVLRPEVTR